MYWIMLLLAILFEVAGTTSMKLSAGFSRFWPSVGLFFFYAISFVFLTISLKKLNIIITYAIWSALGTFIISLIGVFYFHEAMTWLKAFFILLIIIGVIGLNLSTTSY